MLQAMKNMFVPQTRVDEKMREWHRQAMHTPDIALLEQFNRQLIFVTDNTHDDLLSKASWSGKATNPTCYTLDEYTLWKKDLGKASYSIVLPSNYVPTGFVKWPVEPARIRGALWSIRPNAFISLDKTRGNGVRFIRRRVNIAYNYRTLAYDPKKPLPHLSDHNYFTMLQAWMYVGVPEYWDAMIGGIFASSQLDTHEHYPPRTWMQKFYQFD